MTQDEALAILKTGANVFLTGEPGSGKTHTINRYVAHLRSSGVEPAITASTGIAATHIGGLTIHSWSGIGVRRELNKYDLDRLSQNSRIDKRVGNSKVLIIDEVSMLSVRTLSMVDAVCREIRRDQAPFGGLQVILVGDFFQLPPVSRREEETNQNQNQKMFADASAREEFSYCSRVWGELNPITCYLSEQHRQEDAVFLAFLTALRRGTITDTDWALLRKRYAKEARPGITQLYSHNADVDRINDDELSKLSGKPAVFVMKTSGPENLVGTLKRGCLSPETLSLKVGANVMFTKNDVGRHRYVNGTLGSVIGFSDEEDNFPVIKTRKGRIITAEPSEWRVEDGGRVWARITQVPLRLAWAMTVHKSQGMSLDAAHMDLGGTFEYGQGYVALSRVRTLEGLTLSGLNRRALEVHPEVCQKDKEFRAMSEAARAKFKSMERTELSQMHANFIRAIGGKPGSGRESAHSPQGRPSTYELTRALLPQKISLKEMAGKRGVTLGTIIGHLEKLAFEKKIDPLRDLAHIDRDPSRFEDMRKALKTVRGKDKQMPLAPARAILGEAVYSYDELRLARLFVRAEL